MPAFDTVVVANRGAVAARVIRALGDLGIRSVAVYSEADAGAPYLELADQAHPIGPGPAGASYLDQEVLLDVVRRSAADAVHPGYGFLAEHAGFARRVVETGARWIGPSPEWLEMMGDKAGARSFAAEHGLPVAAGSGVLPSDLQEIAATARSLGYPLLVKPAGGGGGMGMISVQGEDELAAAVARASRIAARGFANGDVYLERLLVEPRHIEFQILADFHGAVMHVFERDCSVQRRHQKIIEEAPAPSVDRMALHAFADALVEVLGSAGYDNIGTVESLLGSDGDMLFLEMNTRLQVEHGVTEEITGLDLVAAQVRLAAGERLGDVVDGEISVRGHAVEARVYAEDPVRFLPSPGHLEEFAPPPGLRVETGYRRGMDVPPFYDPLLAKVVSHASTRGEAIANLIAGLEEFVVGGVETNIPALISILRSEEFASGEVHTNLAPRIVARAQERSAR